MESETTTAPELTLEQALEQIEELTAKADELSEDLEYCRDQLFTLLQRESDVSEQSIIDAFRRIFEGLDSWIDEISTSEGFETEFKSQYNKNLTRSMEDRSKTLGLSWLCQDIGWLTRLGKLKTCRYAVLTLVVTRCLKENVFRLEDSENWEHIYPFGFPNMDVELLVQVQEAMASDDIQKDPLRIGRWRKDAVTALISTTRMQNRAFEEASYVKSRLRKDLEFWIEERTLDKYIDSLETKVLQRAYRVLNLIGHSNKTFMFLGQNLQPGSMQESSVSSTIIDISTWQGTPFNKSLGALQCLYLGLVRKALPDEEEDLILVHPTLLGYSAKEMETQSTLGELKSFSKQETHRPDREERDTGTFIRPSKPGRAGSSSKHSSRATDFKPISLPPKEPSKSLTWESWILGSERVPGFSAKAEIKGISRKIRHRIGKAKKPASHSQRRQERQYESRTLPSGSVTYGGPQRAIGPDDGSINNPTLHGYYTADDRSEYYEYDPPQIYNEAADQGDDYRFRRSETE